MGKSGEAGGRGSGADVAVWQLWIDDTPRPGWANMSIDLGLLDRAQGEEGWLRLYQWSPHCLSFGRHEPALRRYDVERITRMRLDTVRRPTGGRAVWHARELTYAVAAPLSRFGSPQEAYREIHELLRDTLAGFGIDARLAPRRRTPGLDAGPCFASAAGGEVLIHGRKTVGSAQLCRGFAVLQHGSILLENEQDLVESLIQPSCTPPRQVPAAPVAALLRHDRRVGLTELSEAVAQTAAARWPGAWKRVSHAAPVLRAAADHFAQFQSPEWTWIR